MVRLTLQVTDISTVWTVGFRYILIYKSDTVNGTYTYDGSVALVNGTSSYTYDDAVGTAYDWYKSQYANTVPPPDPTSTSSWSDAVRGDEGTLFHNITYPPELELDSTDDTRVKKIRIYIGDQKEVVRDYVEECYSAVHDDGYTYELSQKGWPVYVSLNEMEKTSSSDPLVDGYRYLKFIDEISTVTGTLDVYYYTFRWSNREILEHYNNAMIPPGLTSSTVTTDHMILQTSIDLLDAENWRDYIENGARIVDSDTTWDPGPGYRAREDAIKRLQKRLDDLVKQYILVWPGWRVD